MGPNLCSLSPTYTRGRFLHTQVGTVGGLSPVIPCQAYPVYLLVNSLRLLTGTRLRYHTGVPESLTREQSPAAAIADDILSAMSPTHYLRSLGYKPYLWQEVVASHPGKRKLVNGARQSGKSTILSGVTAHTAKYVPGSLSVIVAAIESQAVEDMERVKGFVAKDPALKQVRSSDSLIEFSNGSRIMVVPATEKAARGWSAPRVILLDEASRIEDTVYASGIQPMTTNNPDCVMIAISTPNGREGFFYRAWQSDLWERFEIKAPWQVVESTWSLLPTESEEAFRSDRALRGIWGFYSPRHEHFEEQSWKLKDAGPRNYRQEYLVEFVEKEGAAFSYADIDAMMRTQARPIEMGGLDPSPLEALRFDE